MSTRRIIGISIVVAGALAYQAAGVFAARRIEQQRPNGAAVATQAASLRIDGDRLMNTVRTLADPKWEGRAAGSPGGLAARAWIVERYKSIGLQPVSGSYVHPFTYSRTTAAGKQDGEGANVLGLCPGTDPALPMFVVSAHYDHVGVRDGQVYPGADDNASGVAVILELAAHCQKAPFRHTILFAAWDAEERGLQGARAFVAKPPIQKDRIALNVNLDMVSRSDKREIYIAGTHHYPSLKAPLEAVARRARITVLFGHDQPASAGAKVDDWTNQSDHGAFHAAKIPFVYFGVEDHADYHKPTDTFDKINRAFFVDVAETILDSLVALDRAP
jgi:Zn-dependent M28 family amino/carboxypeptidase